MNCIFKKRNHFWHLEITIEPPSKKEIINTITKKEKKEEEKEKNENPTMQQLFPRYQQPKKENENEKEYVQIMNRIQKQLKKTYVKQIMEQIDILGVENYERLYYVN
jgi:hypothetical protein